MADGKQTAQIQRDQQQAATPEEAHAAQIEGRLKELHTCLPGVIVAFDPEKQTAQVQPTIQRIFTEKGAVNLPVCVDVPVQFPGGGDFFLTFPVKAGDECILWFSERAIDNWHMTGGTAPPAEYRLHDLSDGMAMVGLNNQLKKIPEFNPADVELRDRDRTVRVTMKHDGTIENVNPIGNTTLTAAGKYIINAPGGFEVHAPTSLIDSGQTTHTGNVKTDGNTAIDGTTLSKGTITGQGGMGITGSGSGGSTVTVTGSISHNGSLTNTGSVSSNGITLGTHTHSGVQPGGGSTGGPQ